MKKAKRILALVLALVMAATIFTTTGFAKIATGDYTSYKTTPTNYFNSIQKIEFSAEQGACWALDMLDDLLYGANIAFQNEVVYKVPVIGTEIKLSIYLRSIDEAMWSLYNLISGLNGDKNCLGNVLSVGGLSDSIVNTVIGWFDLGDLERLNVNALGNQNSDQRVCRANPGYDTTGRAGAVTPSSDLRVVKKLLEFLSDNRGILYKVSSNDGISFGGSVGNMLKGALPDKILPIIEGNLVGFLKDLLYSKLWDEDADAAPSNWTYDKGVQDLLNWLLIDGTGEASANGGKSILGANKEPFLPAMKNTPGAASIDARTIQADRGNGVQNYTMNFYQFVNNAISGLMNGMVGDLLYDLFIGLADVDDSDGHGDPEALTSGTFSLILGIVEGLFEACGAPAFNYSDDAKTYPADRIRELIDWLMNRGGLDTFIKISYNGISIQPAFTVLLRRVLGLIPTIMPLLGLDIPDGVIHSGEEFDELVTDEVLGTIYETFDGVEVYIPDYEANVSLKDQYFEYVSDHTAVNTTDPTQTGTYVVPDYILPKHVIPESAIWADILKVVLYSVIDGCYFPEWADTISEVGAYGLASLAAAYLPQNNYFDRLDAYHYTVELNESYTPKGTTGTVEPLAYTEPIYVSGINKTVTVPRAAADIGASLAAFFLNGTFPFSQTLGFTPETDTNFETYLFEFLFWGAKKYMPLLTGQYNPATGTFGNISFGDVTTGTIKGTWQDLVNNYAGQFNSLRTQYPPTQNTTGNINNIPASAIRSLVYPLIDNTLFKLIPISWLPQWVGNGGASALFNYWLGDSLVNFNLPQLFDLFQINPTGEFAQNSVIKVIINLLDRILGLLLGGNAVLPACSESNNRNVFNQTTNLTTLESFLGSRDAVGSFLQMFLYYLNRYGNALLTTALPLIVGLTTDTVKGISYKEAGSTAIANYIGSNHVTLQMLDDYIKYYNDDHNNQAFADKIYFDTETKANTVKDEIGATETGSESVDGGTKYYVVVPEEFSELSKANKAVEYVTAYLKSLADQGAELIGTQADLESKRVRNPETGLNTTVYYVIQKMDYKSATADLNVSYTYEADGTTVKETIYNYSNFRRATPSPRAGTLGEVTYGDGYILLDREDYTTDKIPYLNRRNNAVEDAEKFIEKYNEYIGTLNSAYGSWVMYLVNLQLKNANIYDKNSDNQINDDDTYPGDPGKKTPYPFYNGSGSSKVVDWDTDETYAFNYATAANSPIIAKALENAAEVDDDGKRVNDVTLSNAEAESVVRLALGNITFDITQDENGNYGSNTKQWEDLVAADITKINTQCGKLGFTYNSEDNTITRPAFALIKSSNGGYTSFGSYDGTTIPFTPISSKVLGASGDVDELKNNIQEAYVEFAKSIREYDTGVAEHYDDISWRAAIAENQISTSFRLNAINWALDYTESAYYPAGDQNPRNKRYNNVDGSLVSAYSRTTFAPFQQAYDYAQALRNYMASGNAQHVTQSLVSTAYRELMDTFYRLKIFEGKADWAELLDYIALANQILDSEIGLDTTGATPVAKDPNHGYTLESLIDLKDAVDASQALYNEFEATYDSDYQSIIDNSKTNLYDVIDALKFAQGDDTKEDLLISTSYTGDIDKVNYTQGNRIKGILFGFEEGVGLTQEAFEDYKEDGTFTPTGYVVSEMLDKHFLRGEAGKGNGTGTFVYGKSGQTELFRYTVVIKGDINGDTRIDGNDKVAIDSVIAQEKVNTIPIYEQAAADVDGDGDIDAFDLDKIKAHYTYRSYGDVTGEISQTGEISSNWGVY